MNAGADGAVTGEGPGSWAAAGNDERERQARGGGRAPDQRSDGVRHSASFSSSSAMRCSSSATRFLSDGSCRKTADDFSQSRFAMAGYPETNAPASTEFGMPVCAVAIDALAERQVAGDAHLPRQHDVVLDRRAAGDADLRGQQRPAPDRDAVRDLHEVVDLRARADARLADRGPIDRRVGADLHVVLDDQVGVLRDLGVRAVGPLDEAEAVAAEDGAVLHDDAVAEDDALADRDVRVQHAVLADPRARADDDVRDRRPCARRSTRPRRS